MTDVKMYMVLHLQVQQRTELVEFSELRLSPLSVPHLVAEMFCMEAAFIRNARYDVQVSQYLHGCLHCRAHTSLNDTLTPTPTHSCMQL